jgi:hypothetical protein
MSETNTIPASSLAAEFEALYSEIKELREKVEFLEELFDIKAIRDMKRSDETGCCHSECGCYYRND